MWMLAQGCSCLVPSPQYQCQPGAALSKCLERFAYLTTTVCWDCCVRAAMQQLAVAWHPAQRRSASCTPAGIPPCHCPDLCGWAVAAAAAAAAAPIV